MTKLALLHGASQTSSDGTATMTFQARSKPLLWWNTAVIRAAEKIESRPRNRADISITTKTTAPETMSKPA